VFEYANTPPNRPLQPTSGGEIRVGEHRVRRPPL